MDKKINISNRNSFLEPINVTLNSHATKESFDYAISLIGRIQDPVERLTIFNQFMEFMYIKVSQGETTPDLSDVISKRETSEPLADFLKTFGKNWKEITEAIPGPDINLVLDALQYTRNPIKFAALKDEILLMPQEKRIELIKSLDLDDQKEYFISPEHLEEYGFSPNEMADILSGFKYDTRKLQYLTKNSHTTVQHLGKKQIVAIANSLTSDSKRLTFLRPGNVEFFNLSNVDCTNIINSLQSDTSKIRALSDYYLNKQLDLTPEQVCDIIANLEDDKSKMQYLAMDKLYKLFPQSSQKDLRAIATKITCSLTEDKNKLKYLTPAKVKELGLANFNIALITTTLTDDKNKQKIMQMSDGSGKHPLKLNSKNFARIVSSFESDKAKIDYMNSLPRNEDHKSEKAKIVSSLKSVASIERYLTDPDIAPYKNAILLGMFSDKKSVSKSDFDTVCRMAGIFPEELHSLSIPVLPDKMTIGVELETVGLNNQGNASTDLFREFRKVFGGFDAKRDISLSGYNGHGGVEIISPILMNHNLENLNLVARLIQMNNLGVNETCGAHVHIGADFLDSTEAWKNLCEIWGNNEDLMYQITNQQGSALRGGVKEYARPISPKIAKALQEGSINLESEQDLDKFVNAVKNLQYGEFGEFTHIVRDHPEINPHELGFHKYYGLNFKNINSVNKNTIEFRLPNGTVDPQTLMDNIRLFSSVVAISKELGDTELAIKSQVPLTDRQRRLMLAKKALTSEEVTNNPDARMSALMHLLFEDDPRSQQTYINRYRSFPKDSIAGIQFGKFKYRPVEIDASEEFPLFDRFSLRDMYRNGRSGIQNILGRITRSRQPSSPERPDSTEYQDTGHTL